MGILRSALIAMPMAFAVLVSGCGEPTSSSHKYRQNIPVDGRSAAGEREEAGSFRVNGRISSEGAGSTKQKLAGRDILALAKKVRVSKLEENGDLTPVTETDVGMGGAFEVDVPNDGTGTNLFIMEVLDIGGAILGAGVVNGLPAFVQAFVIDATIDTATSFKTEILVTLQKRGVPGVQNYLNVLDTYVNAQLANSIAVVGVLSTDLNSLVDAVADAVIAAQGALFSALEAAGVPIDTDALLKAQSSAVAGFQNLVTSATGELVANAKNLVASLQAATKQAAAPIDQAIFNAIVGSGAVFERTFKQKAPAGAEQAGFAASKSVFEVETSIMTDWVENIFKQAGVSEHILDKLLAACHALNIGIAGAKTPADLNVLIEKFEDALLGRNEKANAGILHLLAQTLANIAAVIQDVTAKIAPLSEELASVLTAEPCDLSKIGAALSAFDAGTKSLPSSFSSVLADKDAQAIAKALNLSGKVIAR